MNLISHAHPDLVQWNTAIRAWREMRAARPLGIFYRYPEAPIPVGFVISGHRPANGYPAAFSTFDKIASGA